MEYYTLSRYAYWKYYILIFYYKLAEYPRPVRVWLIFGSICMLLLIMIVIGNALRTFAHYRFEHLVLHNRERYYERMKTVVSQARTLEPSEVSAILELPKNFKMKERQNRSFVPVLMELRREMSSSMSRPNWIRLTQALKMPAYFESQILSRSIRKKVQGFKDVADLDANLKEAVASRYLFTKNRKLQMHARLHAARFGTSYPFKVLEDDPNLVFTEEMVVKYHNVLVYRQKNGLTMPNFIRWCNRVPINEELRIFAVNEIRLFKRKEDCAELLAMLKASREEAFSCAIIRALGELEYVPAEAEFCRRYLSASFTERQVLADALGALGTGNPETLKFMVDDFLQTTDYVTRMVLLRVIYRYGDKGRAAYEKLKAEATPELQPYFAHIECDLIDSRRYA
ncbi:MAG: hypothetical protein II454_02770 [Bacteroidales bacterium]|nr:hypothetical protein [Bacteroidales bacterium]